MNQRTLQPAPYYSHSRQQYLVHASLLRSHTCSNTLGASSPSGKPTLMFLCSQCRAVAGGPSRLFHPTASGSGVASHNQELP